MFRKNVETNVDFTSFIQLEKLRKQELSETIGNLMSAGRFFIVQVVFLTDRPGLAD